MNDIKLRIMIIDDNPAIHQDFIKILTRAHPNNELSGLENELLSENLINNQSNELEWDYDLPEFIFETASQGHEAVDKIEKALKKDEHFALAFVDIRMPPGWDGIETIQQIWRVDPDVQIVICTAYSDYSWEETLKKLGPGSNFLILKKPFDTLAVRQLASALTRKWLLAKNYKQYTEMLQKIVLEKTQSLQESLSLLRSTIESSADGILVLDLHNKIVDWNSKFLFLWDTPKTLMDAKDGTILMGYIQGQLAPVKGSKRKINIFEKKIDATSLETLAFKNGKIVECYSQPHFLNEKIVGRVWSFRDVTDRANLEKKLEFQATHDTLTGLPNRILLADRLQHGIEIAKRNKQIFAVLFFDLDRFKLVNDSLSHQIGDDLLCLAAKRLSSVIRKEDTLARLGGDEFVLIIPGLKEPEKIFTVANKILQSFQKPFKLANRNISITTSIGISIFPTDGKTVDTLLKNADLAMYQAKEKGGNQFHFYTSHLNKQTNKRLKEESELRRAIEYNEFLLFYQPQFDINNKKLLSLEALVRWQHPERGLLLPIDFLPIAEKSGLVILMGEWVIREVCRQITLWQKKGLSLIPVAINLAIQQLKQANFASVVKKIIKEFQVDTQFIEFEVTENMLINHRDTIRMVNQLQELGIKIVLDDFGTGSSGLNYLKRIRVDRLKIDQSFVQNISTSRNDEVIIEAIIAMARSFHFKILAEGVETQNQMDYLKKQLCDEAQGFFLSKPLPANGIESYIKKNNH